VLSRLLSDYDVVDFSKSICWSYSPNIKHKPDLALISKSRRRWVIVEVELSEHILGYSYSSPLNRRSDHIYPQVETFAQGIYEEGHLVYLAKKLKVSKKSLNHLLLFPPEILVIGDDEDVIRTDNEVLNWKRLEEDFDNVHLAFVENYKWENNNTDSCSTYRGWLPPTETIERVRLTRHEAWPHGLNCISPDENLPLLDGENTVYVGGIESCWMFKEEYGVLMPQDSIAQEFMDNCVGIGLFEIIVGDRIELEEI
jgi:hypothetical protein